MYAYLITSNSTVELGPPNNVHFLVPGTYNNVILHGKRVFADVIKVKDLETGAHLGLFRWAQSKCKSP